MGEAKRRKQKDPTWGKTRGKGTVQFKKLIHLGDPTHITPEQLQRPELMEILKDLVPGVSATGLDLNCVFIGYLEKAGKALVIPVMLPLDDPQQRIFSRCRYQDGWGQRTKKESESYVQMVMEEILKFTSSAQDEPEETLERGLRRSDAA